MVFVEAPPRHYLELGGAQTVGSMQVGSGGRSRQSLPLLVRGIACEDEEQGVALLLSTSEQYSERHAQLSRSPLVVGVVVAACLPSARLTQLAQNGVAPVRNPYSRWFCQKQRVSQLKDYLHVRLAATSPRKREDPDAGG